jgi:amylosucrase
MRPIPPETSWVTYVRGHDDIGWAVSDEDAGALGLDGAAHRRFLNDFYSGRFPGSFARGALFQENAATGDARISGSAASLCGIEAALESGDTAELDAGIQRLLLLYSVAYAWGGIPLLYMGDELALRNDDAYLADPARAPDNRWMHRPPMDWTAADRRHDPGSLEGRVFAGVRRMGQVRRSLLALRGSTQSEVLDVGADGLLVWRRRHPRSGTFIGAANFSPHPAAVDADTITGLGAFARVLSSDETSEITDGRLIVPGLGYLWYAEA